MNDAVTWQAIAAISGLIAAGSGVFWNRERNQRLSQAPNRTENTLRIYDDIVRQLHEDSLHKSKIIKEQDSIIDQLRDDLNESRRKLDQSSEAIYHLKHEQEVSRLLVEDLEYQLKRLKK